MIAHLTKTVFVEAAHYNPQGAPAQQRLHGHSFRIDIQARGAVDPALGWVVDYAEIKETFAPLIPLLDHGYLNEIHGLEEMPTLEGLRRWLESGVAPRPDWLLGVRVSIAGDLCFRPVRFSPDPQAGLPERIGFSFEAAQSLPQLPEGHPCRRIHGHSYRVEASAPDLTGLEPHLADIYDALDHRFLNDVEGLEQATCERIAEWVWDRLNGRGIPVTLVGVQETPSARCRYYGE